MNKINLCILACAALLSSAAARADVNPEVSQTLGDGNYSATKAFVQVSDEDSGFFIAPQYSVSKSSSQPTMSVYSLKGGMNLDRWNFDIEGGITPKADGYSNKYVTGNLGVVVATVPETDDAYGFLFQLGATATHTANADEYDAAHQKRSSELDLAQNEYGPTATIKLLDFKLETTFTKTAYDKNVDKTTRKIQHIMILGVQAATSGLPSQSIIDRNLNNALCDWFDFAAKQGAMNTAYFPYDVFSATRLQRKSGQPLRGGPPSGLVRRCVCSPCGHHAFTAAPSASPDFGPSHRALFRFLSITAS
jgi:hypothetical protein